MGIFEQFPYSNFHNANLDNVLHNSNQALRDAANAVHIAGEAKDIAEGLADDVATALQEAEAASTAAASAEATAAQAQAEAEAVSGLAQDAYDLASAADSAAANALSVANTANSNASAAVATANAASTAASNAVSTANAASSNASAAVSTANTANTNASAAVNTANAALDAVNNIPDASTTEKGLVQFPVTIAQGGTGATDATNARANLVVQPSYTWNLTAGVATSFRLPNNSRHLIAIVGSAVARDGLFIARAASGGAVSVTDIHKGSYVSYTTAANNFTITVTGGVATIMFITLYGGLVTKN